MDANETNYFDREKSDAIFTETLDYLDNLNTRDGRFEYADYVTLHNCVTALYDSFSHVDEIIKALQEKESWLWEMMTLNEIAGIEPISTVSDMWFTLAPLMDILGIPKTHRTRKEIQADYE